MTGSAECVLLYPAHTMLPHGHHGVSLTSRSSHTLTGETCLSVFPLLQQKQQLLLSFPSIFSFGDEMSGKTNELLLFFVLVGVVAVVSVWARNG